MCGLARVAFIPDKGDRPKRREYESSVLRLQIAGCKEMKKKDIVETVDKLVADNKTVLRSAVSILPWVGGALDHLIFDRYDEIRLQNIELALKSMTEQINTLSEAKLVKGWFETTEALNVLKTLFEAIEVEHETGKIDELARVFPVAGTSEFVSDPLKVSIMSHLGQMTDVSIKLLRIVGGIAPTLKKVGANSLSAQLSAIWPEQLREAIKTNPRGGFWKGGLDVDVEMDILASKNLVRRIEVMVTADYGYNVTSLGLAASKYLTA